MNEEIITNDLTDIVTEQPAQETPESVQPETKPQQSAQPDIHEENYRSLRQARMQAERERDELYRQLQMLQQQKQQQEPEEDLSINIAEGDYVEGKHLSKVDKKIRKLEQAVAQYQKQAYEFSIEAQVKATYPDYDRVVNAETIERLKAEHPDIAQTLASSTDLKSKALSTYKMIEKLGLAPNPAFDHEKQLVQRNAAKPRPVASVSPQQGDSPLSNANAFANGLTDELKNKLHKEMMAAMRAR